MKITYITQACVLIESDGKKILCDPWLVGPCWAKNLWHYPPPKREPESFTDIDYIYFSHGHEDHFQIESINRLPLQTKKSLVLISDYDKPYWERAVRAAGFENVQILQHNESIELTPNLKLDMIRNDKGDDDSSIVVQSDNSTVFFQTDNLMSYQEAERLGNKYNIDLFFTIPTLTGIFPAFFDFEPSKMMELAKKKHMASYKYSTELVRLLKAQQIVPYACDLCYFGDLYFANDIHYSDKQKYANYVKEKLPEANVIIMGPDDQIDIHNGKIKAKLSPQYYTRENLGAYAVKMLPKYKEAMLEERMYAKNPYEEDIVALRKELDRLSADWQGNDFNVLWRVIDDMNKVTSFWHCLPGKTIDKNTNNLYNLMITIPSYRLQRWARGHYHMGGQTIRNGVVRCHRHVDELTKDESNYWDLTQKIRF